MHKLAIVVPIFNHARQFERFLPKLLALRRPIILSDDGSAEAAELEALAKNSGIFYTRNPKNLGKGAAFLLGAKKAEELGFTHIFQIDADGQHSLESFADFEKASAANPGCVINSAPLYHNAPASRFFGRKITNFWVRLEVPRVKIADAMCGYRIYPLPAVLDVAKRLKFLRMGFDIEIIVRIARAGCGIINLPVNVDYPQGGASNFKMIGDNFKISLLHTMLCAEGVFNFIKKAFKWKRR